MEFEMLSLSFPLAFLISFSNEIPYSTSNMLGKSQHLKGLESLIEMGRVISESSMRRHTLPPRLILWIVSLLSGDGTISTKPGFVKMS